MNKSILDQTFEEFEKFCSDLRTSNDLWRCSEDETLSKIEDKAEEIKNKLISKIEARIKELEKKSRLFTESKVKLIDKFMIIEGRIAELKEMLK
jgi:hypothetical protein